MDTPEKIKESVREKYSQIAKGDLSVIPAITSCCTPSPSATNAPSAPSSRGCCGGGGAEGATRVILDVSERYADVDKAAIPQGADLGLGCGTPAAFAGLAEGMTVLDLGSGAGIDCFVAAQAVGAQGKVIGVDMTAEMIARANENKVKVDARNVEFRLGEIEHLPVADRSVDRVISNCVINLVPDKNRAFGEIFRVLRPGGTFTVSDIVVDGAISEAERRDASLWAGCISGALQREDYLAIIRRTGFADVRILSEKRYDYALGDPGAGLYSVTITATRP